jgi:crossover junction endodeoxyribonuclease RuvC
MFVLGIDPGLSTTGYGVVEVNGATIRAVVAGVIRTSPDLPLGDRLVELHRDALNLMQEHQPDEAAIEQVFVNRNLQTATAVGRASGVLLLAAAQAGIPMLEYTPSAVKMALTGYGGAPKAQVGEVVAMRLRLGAVPAPADAADALAVALCHAQALPLRRAMGRISP